MYSKTRYNVGLADAYRGTTVSGTDENENLLEEDCAIDGAPEEGLESDDDTNNLTSLYGQLLQSLSTQSQNGEPATKKRKLLQGSSESAVVPATIAYAKHQVPNENLSTDDRHHMAEIDFSDSEPEEAADDSHITVEEDREEEAVAEEDVTDPFEFHFANPDVKVLSEAVKAIKEQKWVLGSPSISEGVKHQYSVPASSAGDLQGAPRIRAFEDLRLKRRIAANGQKIWSTAGATDREVASAIFTYRDILFGLRTVENASRLRDLVMLHALNHLFKTRDRVIKNNSKLTQGDEGDLVEIRDQGFTRPKVLFILPTRQACVRFVDSMVKICQPEQQENKSRFMEGFSQVDENPWREKPRDFQELFGGNDDDMFRLGLKFTRKTIKFFSAFYNSDVIFASPLGLRTAIETGGSKDTRKGNDADFLSSIEVVIVDHANALLMQNWQHVEYIFSQLNLLPKESHGCDFSRVRHWYLDGQAKYIRQTIILTDFITPEMNSIYTKFMFNVAGRFRFAPVYQGTILDVSISLPVSISQVFVRLNAPNPASDADVRFSHFTSSILPSMVKSKQEKGTLIFMSTYLDFVRLRNHFSTSTTTASLSFGAISEYSSVRDIARARSHFLSGRHSVLLYSERAHHFRRYRLKGVKRVVFYSLPENPIFWSEMIALLDPDLSDKSYEGRRTVRALFSRWDVLKLERIVGTLRVGKMVNDKAGDTFEFT